jgi:Spy/CpxP family protein refolding chaperone
MKAMVFVTAILAAGAAVAAGPYAGREGRAISSLSAEDVAHIEAGRGWGPALPAEPKGYPGPAHVPELADALALTEAQKAETQAIFAAMEAEAQAAGRAHVAAERALDAVFEGDSATPDAVAAATADAGAALGRLRAAHLTAHLTTAALLTPAQRSDYGRLRGYAAAHGAHGHGSHDGGGHGGHGAMKH